MKPPMIATTVATLPFVPDPPARTDGPNDAGPSLETGRRETRKAREDRLRAAQRRHDRRSRETRKAREDRLRAASRVRLQGVWT